MAYILPTVATWQQIPIKEAALLVKKYNYPVVMWRLNNPSFEVYTERLVARRMPRSGEVVLTKSPYLSQLGKSEVLYRRNGIVLAKPLRDETASSGKTP